MDAVQASIMLIMDGTEGNPDQFPRRHFTLGPGSTMSVGRSSSGLNKSRPGPKEDNAYFDSPVVSRLHAELSFEPNRLIVRIRDLESMHGTMVNNKKLSPRVHTELSSGTVVTLGVNVTQGHKSYPGRTFRICYTIQPRMPTLPKLLELIDEPKDAEKSASSPKAKTAEPSVFVVPDSSCDEFSIYSDSDEESELDDEELALVGEVKKVAGFTVSGNTLVEVEDEDEDEPRLAKDTVAILSEGNQDTTPTKGKKNGTRSEKDIDAAAEGNNNFPGEENRRPAPRLEIQDNESPKDIHNVTPSTAHTEQAQITAADTITSDNCTTSMNEGNSINPADTSLSKTADGTHDAAKDKARRLETQNYWGTLNFHDTSSTINSTADGLIGKPNDAVQTTNEATAFTQISFPPWAQASNECRLSEESRNRSTKPSFVERCSPQYHSYYPVNGINGDPYPPLTQKVQYNLQSLASVQPTVDPSALSSQRSLNPTVSTSAIQPTPQEKAKATSLDKCSIANIVDPQPPLTTNKRKFTAFANDNVAQTQTEYYSFPEGPNKLSFEIRAEDDAAKEAREKTRAPENMTSRRPAQNGVQKASQTSFPETSTSTALESPTKKPRTTYDSAVHNLGPFVLGALVGGIGLFSALVAMPESMF